MARQPAKRAKKPRRPLDKEAIELAALALIDKDGLGELSMRRLGKKLGVEAMSLYHHYPSKAHLLDALLDRLIATSEGAPIVVTSAAGSPEGYVLARRGQLAHYIGPLVATSAAVATRLLDAVLERLAGREVCLDLHRGGLLAQTTLADQGLAMRRTLTRMYVGPGPHPGTSPWICASAGPEIG